MKKFLEKTGKDELIEYSRLGDKFSVGNHVGSSSDFHIFTSINPYGKYEGYKFLKNLSFSKIIVFPSFSSLSFISSFINFKYHLFLPNLFNSSSFKNL